MHRKVNTHPVNIYKCKVGRLINNYFICIDKKVKKTKTGDRYIDITLKNSLGIFDSKLWNNVNYFNNKFNTNDTVAIKGVCDEYNGNRLIKILSINKVHGHIYDRYAFNINVLFSDSKKYSQTDFGLLDDYFNFIERKYYLIIRKIYNDNFEKLSKIPLTLYKEYSYQSGYINHLFNLLTKATAYSDNKGANYSKLLVCILIHDIGKLDYFDCSNIPKIASDGLLLGASNLGVKIIEKYGKKGSVDKDVVDILCHIILCYNQISNDSGNSDISIRLKEITLLKQLKKNDLSSFRK